jgi:hypothetical protein
MANPPLLLHTSSLPSGLWRNKSARAMYRNFALPAATLDTPLPRVLRALQIFVRRARMDDEKLLEKLKELTVWTGHREMSIEDVATIQPGLGRIMPEIGARTWKLYYAAKAENWPLATFQAKEIKGLMELGAFTRPKHEEALNQYMEENWKPLQDAVNKKDFKAFEEAFNKAIEMANAYHELKDKPYIVWKLPDTPPPDLDLRPRKKG